MVRVHWGGWRFWMFFSNAKRLNIRAADQFLVPDSPSSRYYKYVPHWNHDSDGDRLLMNRICISIKLYLATGNQELVFCVDLNFHHSIEFVKCMIQLNQQLEQIVCDCLSDLLVGCGCLRDVSISFATTYPPRNLHKFSGTRARTCRSIPPWFSGTCSSEDKQLVSPRLSMFCNAFV